MLFMVIERYAPENVKAIGERFRSKGRMLPDGVTYQASWLEPSGLRCFQLMEAPDEAALAPWTCAWQDLVDFEIIPVLTSAEFWSRKRES